MGLGEGEIEFHCDGCGAGRNNWNFIGLGLGRERRVLRCGPGVGTWSESGHWRGLLGKSIGRVYDFGSET